MLRKLRKLVRAIWFRTMTGYSEKQLLSLYANLARLDYREPRTYYLSSGRLFAISTLKGGPRINLFPNYEILMKYSNQNKQLYIQVNESNDFDGWTEVYRTGEVFKYGLWFPVLVDLIKHNPCVPNVEQGFL